MLTASLHKKTFHFNFEARTSRGVMKDRTSWFIKISESGNPDIFGVGECAPLAGLSPEFNEHYESKLGSVIDKFNALGLKTAPGTLADIHQLVISRLPEASSMSSVIFGLETALLDLFHDGERVIFRNSFIEGKPVPINGLVWMGGMDFMLQQIEIKIRDGFRCIKLKVGGLDFEKECDVLQYVRRKYFREDITVRLDANGALKPEDALYKLNELAKFKIHSIEQPLKKGSEHLAELCAKSPIPIALDEELLGVNDAPGQEKLLKNCKPRFIILKPSLHGGLYGANSWIETGERLGIKWWLTSALESNIGLNALSQFVSEYPVEMPQGLGTGSLYDDNFLSPLEVQRTGTLAFNKRESWDIQF